MVIWRAAALLGAVALAACSETVITEVTQKEADEIIEFLAENDIEGTKDAVETGAEVSYSVTVPKSQGIEAIHVVMEYFVRKDKREAQVNGESGSPPRGSPSDGPQTRPPSGRHGDAGPSEPSASTQ